MVDLSIATQKEIDNELAQRKKLLHDDKIQEYITAINKAHAEDKISNINIETTNVGASVAVAKYYVFLK